MILEVQRERRSFQFIRTRKVGRRACPMKMPRSSSEIFKIRLSNHDRTGIQNPISRTIRQK